MKSKRKFDDDLFANNLLDIAIDLCSRVCNWSEQEKNDRVVYAIKQCKQNKISKNFTETEKIKTLAAGFIRHAVENGHFLTTNDNRFVI